MIKIDNYEVVGWTHAIRGMRNPMNSWDKSDSDSTCFGCKRCEYGPSPCCDKCDADLCQHRFIGPNDLELMKRLVKAGTDHRKFMRMIVVYLDITAPRYFWTEMDTYRVGRVDNPTDIEMNSCSTMHKIHEKEFTYDDFSCEHLFGNWKIDMPESEVDTDCYIEDDFGDAVLPFDFLHDTISILNKARERYLETKDKKYWWQMIQLLPQSYNQKRTIMMNYEVLANMYKSRKNHKLDEWVEFCKWIETLPYSELITGDRKNVEDIQ